MIWKSDIMSPDQDERPFREVLRDWGRAMGYTRAQQATALGVSMSGLNKWHDGAATPGTERTLRILMTLLIERAGWSAHSPAHQGNHDANQRHD